MTEETQLLVIRALKQALRLQIGQLFNVLASSNDPAALDRFKRGVNKAVTLYEELRADLDVAE